MDTWSKESNLRQLVVWVKGESGNLSEGRDKVIHDLMDRVANLLDSPAEGNTQMILVFSAILQCVKRAERLVLDAMSLDHWITLREEALLVHLRLACAEMINLLTNASDDLRFVPVRVRLP